MLLVNAQVIIKMVMVQQSMPMLMISIKTIVILLMLGLLFLGGAPPRAQPAVAEEGIDWLRSFS